MECEAGSAEHRVIVSVIGHSFIRRLGEFVTEHREYGNLRLDNSAFLVYIRGKGGLTVPGLANSSELLCFRVQPDIVYVEIGSNDLTDPFIIVHRLAERIISFAKYLLLGIDIQPVIIGQVLWRKPAASDTNYNNRVVELNKILHRLCRESQDSLIFWHHRGFWSPNMEFLSRDGVHVKCSRQDYRYMKKYLQSIRSAVLHASNHLAKPKIRGHPH